MTFLEICQKTDLLFGTQGTISSVSTATGLQALIVEYARNAWNNIQASRRHWDFYRQKVSLTTEDLKGNYTIDDLFGVDAVNPVENWIVDSFYKYAIGSGQFVNSINYIPYDQWVLEDHGYPNTYGEPQKFTIPPNQVILGSVDALIVLDIPDDVYTYYCHYNRKPQELLLDADVPICPPEHHDAIVFQTITDLAAYTGNADIYSTASVRANQLYNNLLRSQNPSKTTRQRPLV